MRNLTTLLKALTLSSLAGLFLYTAPSAMACEGGSSSAGARALVEVVVPISITKINPLGLMFGYISPDNGGTVTISPEGERTSSGVQVLSSLYSAASFRVSGDPNNTYSISLPASATLSSGSHTMQVTAFTSDPSGAGALDNTTGEQDLHVGATLNVGKKQAPGIYLGAFNVTVAYN